MGVTESPAEFAGMPVVGFPVRPESSVPAGVAWRIDVFDDARSAEPSVFEEVFDRFLTTVQTSQVAALVIGNWADVPHSDNHHPARLLVENAHRLPALRALFLGDVPEGEGDGECDIVYIDHPDLTPVLEAYPRLEELWIRGTPDLETERRSYFEPTRHAGLRRLVLESGGLPVEVLRTLSECDFPELTHLELHLGHPEWNGLAGPGDLAWLAAGIRFPKLAHLGIRSPLIHDELASAFADAPIVARLRTLDLSPPETGFEGRRWTAVAG